MTLVVFYEKPGCINNTKQKKLLSQAGHQVIAKNLLTENWRNKKPLLRQFFNQLPVAEWFNPSAPDIKNGDVTPETLKEDDALELMISNPLLIRRPLIEVNGEKVVGFDANQIENWIGLSNRAINEDLETCPKQSNGQHHEQ